LTNYHVIEPVLRAQLVLGVVECVAPLTARFVDGRVRSVRILAAPIALFAQREQTYILHRC